jgi:hypothetical protein
VHNLVDFLADPSTPVRVTFEKHVIDLKTHEIVERVVYDGASGDFPQRLSEKVVLLNRMTPQKRSRLVLFDTARERVVREVTLPHKASDVVCLGDGRHVVYATMDAVVVYDIKRARVRRSYDIPPRTANFHCSLLRAPGR